VASDGISTTTTDGRDTLLARDDQVRRLRGRAPRWRAGGGPRNRGRRV